MRCLLTASLVAGLAGTAVAHRDGGGPVRHRKSLGFGPVHKHAKYVSTPYQVVTNAFTRMPEDSDPIQVARVFVEDILGNQLSESNSYKIRKDSYTDSNTGITHVYVRQIVNGLEVSDGDMNINVKDGLILSYGNSFFAGSTPAHLSQTALDDDIRHPHQEFCDGLTDELEMRYTSFLASEGDQVVMGDAAPVPKGKALKHLTHTFPLKLAAQGSQDLDVRAPLLQFMVAATPNDRVVNDILSNYDSHLSQMSEYVDVHHFAPTDEMPSLLVANVPDTVNPVKAKLAYIQVPGKTEDSVHLSLVWKFEVEMQDNWYEAAVSATAPHRIISVGKRSTEKESFDALASPCWLAHTSFRERPLFPRRQGREQGVLPQHHHHLGTSTATVTQLFYTTNMVHDLYYRYGFDEVAGNFQQYNFGRGGEGNDATGDFEAGIVIHELSHGLSTRLTGGPLNSGCLPFGESGGMGEGWGGELLEFSANETINPSTYKTLDKPGYFGVHAIGEVWAQILWVVSQGLIEKHGFTDNLFPPAPFANGTVPEGDFYRPASGKKPLVPKHGNSLIFQLVLNAMKLQPCRPGFFEARDAIILADQTLTGGENFCTLWKGFSAKGLGPDANVVLRTPWGGGVRTDDFEVPTACDA
ncbi:hypothetical protein C8R46DRAFT_1058231 [Mycena filopes]|nr:hypothetical protein C8R46DRAFT_1058231 [Mycena filopes]